MSSHLGEPEPPRDVLDTTAAGGMVIRGGLLRVAGYVVGTLASVAASALMLRHLGVVDAGRLVTVMALVAIAAGVSDLGLTGIGVREYTVRHGAERESFMRNLLGMRIVYTSLAMALAVGFAVLAGYTAAMVAGTALAGAGLMLYVIQQSLAIPLSAALRLGWITLLQLLLQVGMALLVVALVGLEADLLPFFAIQLPVMVPLVAVTVRLAHGHAPLVPAFDRKEWGAVMRKILPYSAAVVLNVLYFRIVAVFMSLLSDERETGYFAAAFRVTDGLTLIPPLLISSAFPILARAARDDRKRLAYAVGRLFDAALIGGVWFAIAMVLGADVAIAIVAGDEFEPSVTVLQLLGPALIGTFLVATWGHALLSIERHRAILAANAASLLSAVVLSAVLIPAEGADGGAITLAVAELVLALGYGIALASERELRPRLAIVPRIGLAAAAALAPPLILGLPSLAAAVVGSAIFFAVLAAMGAIPREILEALRPAARDRQG